MIRTLPVHQHTPDRGVTLLLVMIGEEEDAHKK